MLKKVQNFLEAIISCWLKGPIVLLWMAGVLQCWLQLLFSLLSATFFVLLAHTKNFCYAHGVPGLKKAEMASTTSKNLVSFLFRQKFNSFWSIYGSCSGFHTKSEALSYKCTQLRSGCSGPSPGKL